MVSELERAGRAVLAFRELLPSLSAFASMATGRPMSVEVGATPETDGRSTIWLRPPAVLADPREHDRSNCSRRENYRMVCPACEQLDEVYSSVYHEIAHITEDSLQMLTPLEIESAVFAGARSGTPAYFEWMVEQQRAYGDQDAYTYAAGVSPYLKMMLKVADDIRIERASYRARAGVETIRYAMLERILDDGIEQSDGSRALWRDRPVQAQAPVAALVANFGHSLLDRFDSDVVRVVHGVLSQACGDDEPETMVDALTMAVAMLGVFHAAGLYELPIPEDNENDSDASDPGDPGGDSGDPGDPQDADDSPVPMGDEGGAEDEQEGADGAEAGRDGGEGSGVEGAEAEPAASGAQSGTGDAGGDGGDETDDDSAESGEHGAAAESSGAGPAQRDGGSAAGGADQGDRTPGTDEGADGGVADPQGRDGAAGAPVDDPAGDESGGWPDADPGVPPTGGERIFSGVTQASVEEIEAALEEMSGHGENDGAEFDPAVLEQAVEQVGTFDSFSVRVEGLDVFPGVTAAYTRPNLRRTFGAGAFRPVPESVIAPSALHARRIFSESKLDRNVRNLRRGKLDPRTLGRRGWSDDDRVFKRKLRAEGIDFEAVIGLDISGSTIDGCITLIKQAADAMATVLSRVGVEFSVYAHTTSEFGQPTLRQHIYEVKAPRERWAPENRRDLAGLLPSNGSLDGHNLEFYRKILDRSRAKRRAIVYFTDGEIPETNADEERIIIKREVAECKKRGYSMMAVGIGNDSPKKFGLDTIRIDRPDDIVTVLKELERRITST